MWYTLAKGWVWFTVALILGLWIGWLLRSIAARRQVARARNHHVDTVELERLRGRVANLEPVVAERDRLKAELAECRDAVSGSTAATPEPTSAAAPDVAAAAEVLGERIVLDDLKVIQGIGPTVEELCHGIGIRTWIDLSATEVSLLRTMLADAGARFRTHDPSTWPRQAELLAQGRWAEFKALTDELHGGRTG